MRRILLNPGPVTLSDRVRRAMAAEDECHREEAFATAVREVLRRVLRVYEGVEGRYRIAPLTGSGTSAVESMLTAFGRNQEYVVLSNGVYGERMTEILRHYGFLPAVLRGGWTKPLDLSQVDALLREHTGALVAVVHHETTTGRLNDLGPIAALCKEHGCGLLIDAVSSFGGEEIDVSALSPVGLALTSNKCLHSIPGLSFALIRTDVPTTSGSGGYSLDFDRAQEGASSGFFPFTPAVQAVFAAREALRELEEGEGWVGRRRRYRQLTTDVRRHLSDLGVKPLLPLDVSSSMLTAFHLPAERSFPDLHRQMRDDGFVIYAGQGPLSEKIFRISVMGDLGDEDLVRLKASLSRALKAPPPRE